MSYVVFARRYRPSSFDEVVGQQAVARTLANAIAADRVGHAYVFCGPRGVGKTSMARIFARALNCDRGPTADPCGECEICQSIASGNDVDVIEIDGASNRGVEDARRLRQSVAIAPTRSRYKIYIIDEVHMLTTESFNTLLKTLEEPPPHVKFIMATTEPHKILETILSRCQRFDFRRISQDDIVGRLRQICEREGAKADEAVLRRIARSSKGGMRDSQSLLDQLISFTDGEVTSEHLERILGRMDEDAFLTMLGEVLSGDAGAGLRAIAALYERGLDPEAFLDQLIDSLRAVLITCACGSADARTILDESDEMMSELAALGATAGDGGSERLQAALAVLLETAERMRRPGETQTRLLLELATYQLAASASYLPAGEMLARIERLATGEDPPPLDPGGGGGAGPAASGGIGGSSRQHPGEVAAPQDRGGAGRQASRGANRGSAPDAPRSERASSAAARAGSDVTTAVAERPQRATLSAIVAVWDEIIEGIEREHHELGSLLHDACPVELTGGRITLAVPEGYGFHARELAGIEGAQECVLARLRSHFDGVEEVALPEVAPAQGATGTTVPASQPAAKSGRRKAIEQDANVAMALGILGGRVLNVDE